MLLEIPATTLRFFNRNWPASGGGYFRLMPYELSRWMIQRVGSAPLEIGHRRLSTDAYTAPRYTWTPTLEGTHVRVHVENRGMRPITYREEVALQGRGR